MRPFMPMSFLRGVVGAVAFIVSSTSLSAQSRVKAPSAVLATPNGRAIGSVHPGVELRVIETRGAYAKVSVGGYVQRERLSAQRGSASPRVGNRAAVVRARAAATGRSVASFDAGTIVSIGTGATPKGWVRVSRDAWVLKSALAAPATTTTARVRTAPNRATAAAKERPVPARRSSGGEVAARGPVRAGPLPVKAGPVEVGATSTAPKPAVVEAPATATGDSVLSPISNTALRAAPDAKALATVVPGATLVPLARERGWVRVRLEGWVPERDLAPTDSAFRMGVSAADLRADPQGSRGKLVRWSVQILASQKADALRRDLAPDETYLLARGPYEENALLYLVVPPALLPVAKAIPELSQATITARVRTGRSDLVGVPILDLLTLTTKK